MKKTKFGFVYPDKDKDYEDAIIYSYNNGEFEELLNVLSRVVANSNIEPTKSNLLDYLKQKKELLPSIFQSHIQPMLNEISNKF